MNGSLLILAFYCQTTDQTATKWKYKYSLTKNSNSQITINCEQNDQIWIGWSHYGTTIKTQDELNDNLNRLIVNNDNLFNM